MAASLDQWLVDRMYYRVGADLAFTPQPLIDGVEYTSGAWIPAPPAFRNVEGVVSVARVGDFGAHINLSADEEIRGRFLAIDRLDFPTVAWFRPDFASESLWGSPEQVRDSSGREWCRLYLRHHVLGLGRMEH
jgi:hypothetical protein